MNELLPELARTYALYEYGNDYEPLENLECIIEIVLGREGLLPIVRAMKEILEKDPSQVKQALDKADKITNEILSKTNCTKDSKIQ